MTMPVTLVAIAALLPGRTAFAFGLACLVLVMGAIPTFYQFTKLFYNSYLFFVLIILSAASIYLSLRLMKRIVPRGIPGYGELIRRPTADIRV